MGPLPETDGSQQQEQPELLLLLFLEQPQEQLLLLLLQEQLEQPQEQPELLLLEQPELLLLEQPQEQLEALLLLPQQEQELEQEQPMGSSSLSYSVGTFPSIAFYVPAGAAVQIGGKFCFTNSDGRGIIRSSYNYRSILNGKQAADKRIFLLF